MGVRDGIVGLGLREPRHMGLPFFRGHVPLMQNGVLLDSAWSASAGFLPNRIIPQRKYFTSKCWSMLLITGSLLFKQKSFTIIDRLR